MGDLGDATKIGYHVQLSAEGRPPAVGGATLRLDGLYNDIGGKDGGVGVVIWGVNLNLVLNGAMDRASGGVRPYALGGAGYTKEYPVERLLRDAKLYDIGAGTNEIRRFLIGRELVGA